MIELSPRIRQEMSGSAPDSLATMSGRSRRRMVHSRDREIGTPHAEAARAHSGTPVPTSLHGHEVQVHVQARRARSALPRKNDVRIQDPSRTGVRGLVAASTHECAPSGRVRVELSSERRSRRSRSNDCPSSGRRVPWTAEHAREGIFIERVPSLLQKLANGVPAEGLPRTRQHSIVTESSG